MGVLLVKLLENSIMRIQKNRWRFIQTALQTIYHVSSCNLIDRQEHGVLEEYLELKKQSDLVFAQYVNIIVSFIVGIDPRDQQEKELVLQASFQVLAKIYSFDTQIDVDHVKQIMSRIAHCNVGVGYICEYQGRHQRYVEERDRLDVQEISSDDEREREEISNFIPWNIQGIGVFLYLLFIKRIEIDSFGTSIYSNNAYFNMIRPYIQCLFQMGHSTMAKALIKQLLKKMENRTIKTIDGIVERYFDFVQILINFMASCPNDKDRTDAFHILDDYFSKFEDSGKFELLSHILKVCPFESFTGLMIHKLKDEIRFEYDAYLVKINQKLNSKTPYVPEESILSGQPPLVTMEKETVQQLQLLTKGSIFLRKESILLLLEVMKRYPEPNINTSDLLLEAFNLIYWLLLRDSQPNVTGIRNKEILSNISDVITPLQVKINEQLMTIERVFQEKKEFDDLVAQELRDIGEEYDPSLLDDDDEDIQSYKDTTSCRLNLWILNDLIGKIKPLLK